MSFKLHPDARTWFHRIEGHEPFGTHFDFYYLCVMVGIHRGRADHLEAGHEFVNEFIQRYRPYQTLLVGALISAVLKRKGIFVNERETVVKEIARLVNGSSSGGELTSEGFQELNDYAAGGFNEIREQLEDLPNNPIYLLARCREILAVANSDPAA